MMGLAKGSSVVFAAGWMVSDSSTLSVDLKQQRTLNPAQTKRLNVTLIWRLSRIFLKFVDLKDFKSFVGRTGFFSEEKAKPQKRLGQRIYPTSKAAAGANLYGT